MFTHKNLHQVRPGLSCGEGRTKQAMKDQSDINLIMAKYKKTGVTNFVNNNQGEYTDAVTIDFHEAMNTITQAEQMFGQMPAHLRKKFRNSPGEFLDFTHDPKNEDEMYTLGLAQRPEGYVKPEVVATPTPPPETPQTA